MARNGTSKFPIVPVAIGLGAVALLYGLSLMVKTAPAQNREVFRGRGPTEESWAPFVNGLTAGQTFKAYAKDGTDLPYSALAAPDRVRGMIRAKNLQTNQEEAVSLYTINRLGTGA